MVKKIGEFIKNIQHSDDRVKKRWLVIFSSIGMAFVIILWVLYLNVTLPPIQTTPISTSTEIVAPIQKESTEENSFFNTLGRGWSLIWDKVKNNLNNLQDSVLNGWDNFKNEMERTNNLNFEKPEEPTETAPLPQNQ